MNQFNAIESVRLRVKRAKRKKEKEKKIDPGRARLGEKMDQLVLYTTLAIICTRMAIFGTFRPSLLLEPFCLYMSMLHVKRMRLFHLFEKIVKVLLPKSHQKLKKGPF